MINMYTDGGSRGNPGHSAIGIVIKDATGKVVDRIGKYIGKGTNNEAEYAALITGLGYCLNKNEPILNIFLDSELVVKQLKGVYKVKEPRMKIFFAKVKELEIKFEKVNYTHIPRKLNKEADSIVNKVLDNLK